MSKEITYINDTTGDTITFSEAELNVAAVVYDGDFGFRAGEFTCMLIECFFRAIGNNFTKLESQFPEVARAVASWKSGDLRDRVLKADSHEWNIQHLDVDGTKYNIVP